MVINETTPPPRITTVAGGAGSYTDNIGSKGGGSYKDRINTVYVAGENGNYPGGGVGDVLTRFTISSST